MNFNNPRSERKMPRFHEGSQLRSVRDDDNNSKQWQKNQVTTKQGGSHDQVINVLQGQVARLRRRIVGGGGIPFAGFHFSDKIEVDPTKDYDAQTVIHIQPTNDLVVTGIRDAADPDGPVIKSCAGLWVALQDVPAKTTVDGNDVWGLPQYPLPVPTNLDDPLNMWYYMGEVTAC